MASTTNVTGPVPVCLDTRWRAKKEAARELGVSTNWATLRGANEFFKPEYRRWTDGRWYWLISPACFAHLQAVRWAELLEYPLLGNYIPIKRLAAEIGQSQRWIRDTIREHKLRAPQWRRTGSNLTESVSPYTAKKLKELACQSPPIGWHCAEQLSALTGWHHKTVIRRLGMPEATEAGIENHEYRDESGHPRKFYSPGAETYLGKKPQKIPPAGDCMTADRMATELNRDWAWVARRLKRARYRGLGRRMLDDRNVSRVHYPRWVFEELRAESNQMRKAKHARQAVIRAMAPEERRRYRNKLRRHKLRRRRLAAQARASKAA